MINQIEREEGGREKERERERERKREKTSFGKLSDFSLQILLSGATHAICNGVRAQHFGKAI